MVEITNHLGATVITQEYFAKLIGNVTTSCYGVVEMAHSDVSQHIKTLLTRSLYDEKGVKIKMENNQLCVDLHIVVLYGMNISEIVKSIANKIKYTVKQNTGYDVKTVNVYVDGMTN